MRLYPGGKAKFLHRIRMCNKVRKGYRCYGRPGECGG